MDSHYDLVREEFSDNEHRDYVGGLWEEIGELQFNFLKKQGLQPHHKLLDIGCGSLRGGVRFIDYLNPLNYFGLDINPHLIQKGRDFELNDTLRAKVTDENFTHNSNFEPNFPVRNFDFGIAFSLFTHMPASRVAQCLRTLRPKFSNGEFYATFFVVEPEQYISEIKQCEGIVTKPSEDPYHYTLSQIKQLADDTRWNLSFIGNFDHPRNQKMAKFFI